MPYYYLVASLPPLALDEAAPFPAESLPAMWESLVSKSDLDDLHCLVAGRLDEGRHPFFPRWISRETQLRNALARHRAGALRAEAQPFLKDHEGYDVAVETAASEAMAAEDPLQRELALDRFRWRRLDDMARGDRFGPPALFAFVAKLQIAERWQRLTEEAGREILEGIVSENLKSVPAGSAR